MKDHEGSITFHQKNGTRLTSFSCYWHLKRLPQKLIFYTMIFKSKLYTLHYTCYYTGTFPHITQLRVTQPRLQQKPVFMKLTFFTSRTKQIYAKAITVSENLFKIKTTFHFSISL